LDGMLVERVPEFTDAGYLDHTIELVVVENKVRHFVFITLFLTDALTTGHETCCDTCIQAFC
jgi:hypothetical protein